MEIKTIQIQQIEGADLVQEMASIKSGVAQILETLKNRPKPNTKEYLSRNETAKMLGVSLVSLYKWNKSGALKAVKIGKRTLYRIADIEQAVNNSLGISQPQNV